MNFENLYELFKHANAKAFFAGLLLMISTWTANYFYFSPKVTCFDVMIGYIPMIIFFMIVNYHKYSYEHLDNNSN